MFYTHSHNFIFGKQVINDCAHFFFLDKYLIFMGLHVKVQLGDENDDDDDVNVVLILNFCDA